MQSRNGRVGNSLAGARSPLMVALAAGSLLGLGAPAWAIAEAMQEICPEGPPSEVRCFWYHADEGPLLGIYIPGQTITGSRSIIGLVDGYFPLSEHEAMDDGLGGSRVLLEILAGRGEGDPSNVAEVALRSRATGILHTAGGNGTPASPEILARGVAFNSNFYVASVGLAPSLGNNYILNIDGLISSLLLMTDPASGGNFGITEQADVVVVALANLGDLEGEGLISRVHDGIAFRWGTTLIAPTGDGGMGPFPPNMPELAFKTTSAPAAAFNVIAVGATDMIPPPPPPVDGGPEAGTDGGGGVIGFGYDRPWPRSGKGRTDARNWRQPDLTLPAGFRVLVDQRMGPDIIAPGARLRTALADTTTAYARDPVLPNVTELPQEGPGAEGTALACGFVAGAAALLQDAYKAIRESPLGQADFQHWSTRPRMHNTTIKALLLNSAAKSGIWTNQGNQAQGASEPLQITSQPLDTTEGAGQLDMRKLFENFQGRQGFFFRPSIPATMDPAVTDPTIPMRRDPESIGDSVGVDGGSGGGGGGDPPLGSEDPPLGGNGQITPPGGTFLPNPELRPPPPNAVGGSIPNQVLIPGAIFTHSIGWDHGRIGNGVIDYACIEPAVGQDIVTATLVWNRTERINFPTVVASGPYPGVSLEAQEVQLELEDLNLEVYAHDGSGGPRFRWGASESQWNNTEHVFLGSSFFPATALPMIRVAYLTQRYNVRGNSGISGGISPFGDVEFSVAWDMVLGNVPPPPGPGGGNQPPGTPVLPSYPGDLNADGSVNIVDLNMVLAVFGANDPTGDANRDGVVDFRDLNIVLANYGTSAGPGSAP